MKPFQLAVLSLSLTSLSPLFAQPPVPAGGIVYASGLEGPRGLIFGPDGLLYIAEAGHGGTQATPANCLAVPPPVGPYKGGPNARISRVESNGIRTTVVSGLPSGVGAGGDTVGVASVAFLDGNLYALVAGGGCSHGNAMAPNGVYRIDRTKGTADLIANLSDFFNKNTVSHPERGDFESDGTPYDMKAVNGQLVVVEPNHGRLLRISTAGVIEQLTDISAPLGHIVPTAAAWRDGRYYVGMLGGFPISVGSANLYQISAEGHVLDYWLGFTTILGVEVDKENRLYILEFSRKAGFPDVGLGRVLRITGGVVEEIITGLNVPTSLIVGPDGAIYVSDLGAAPAGAGRILRFANPVTGRKLSTDELKTKRSFGLAREDQ